LHGQLQLASILALLALPVLMAESAPKAQQEVTVLMVLMV